MWTVVELAATCPFGQNIAGVEELKVIQGSITQLNSITIFKNLGFYDLNVDWNENRLVDIFNGMYVLKLLFFKKKWKFRSYFGNLIVLINFWYKYGIFLLLFSNLEQQLDISKEVSNYMIMILIMYEKFTEALNLAKATQLPYQAIELLLSHNRKEEAINLTLEQHQNLSNLESLKVAQSLSYDFISSFLIGLASIKTINTDDE